ncbi:AbrB/MazE/SpoVT family DNA-binding domain-containing protein [Rhizobacter sp. OV335]|uniref:AbrB/MazE/SpoVT family DNA-binding domain-containing protein n=1 Tax=Rhizobacter sp. OV335 TaxID=1500264 RepID=UPI000910BBD2|nr:AbrB/MazE/SpoVT family DNA-binding domain-containing protein [Rhizobacter sp. OV335]SHM83340.1 looped-hinge helix DNA binding domain-containing protein, AbrB family [Rhizobacter sp. OV335]
MNSIVPDSIVTAKGRTTIPAQVREQLGLREGTRLVWHLMPDGSLVVRAKTGSLRDMAGMLKSKGGKGSSISIDDVKAWRR